MTVDLDKDLPGWNRELAVASQTFDRPTVGRLCEQMRCHLAGRQAPFPTEAARDGLLSLRRRRMFDWMARLADAFIRSGLTHTSIQRGLAQALLDMSQVSAALPLLERIHADAVKIGDASGRAAALGLIGRAYKQIYVDAYGVCGHGPDAALWRAVEAYGGPYVAESSANLWHGINLVALRKRAERDGLEPPSTRPLDAVLKHSADEQAQAILSVIDGSPEPALWDLATAFEACIALAAYPDAAKWLTRYLDHKAVDAFELASTARQLHEVWQIGQHPSDAQALLALIDAALLKCEGGILRPLFAGVSPPTLPTRYEALLSEATVVKHQWLCAGMRRARSVARIDGCISTGTGFVLHGNQLSEAYGHGPVLVTNSHVMREHPQTWTVNRAADAQIRFELAESSHRVVVGKELWASAPEGLDAAIFELKGELPAFEKMPIAKRVPTPHEAHRIYVIGHPGARSVSYSMHDNLLLDLNESRLHYRSPTEEGSSGSPVFDQKWELLGIHRAGYEKMPRLRGSGLYPANEAIRIDAIRSAIQSGCTAP